MSPYLSIISKNHRPENDHPRGVLRNITFISFQSSSLIYQPLTAKRSLIYIGTRNSAHFYVASYPPHFNDITIRLELTFSRPHRSINQYPRQRGNSGVRVYQRKESTSPSKLTLSTWRRFSFLLQPKIPRARAVIHTDRYYMDDGRHCSDFLLARRARGRHKNSRAIDIMRRTKPTLDDNSLSLSNFIGIHHYTRYPRVHLRFYSRSYN